MVKIFHNNRCSKSRCTLDILLSKGIEHEIIDYQANPPTIEELRIIVKKLNIKPEALVRKSETVYKLNFKNKAMNDEEWLSVLSKHPILIERPIVINGDKAVIGRPPENVNSII